MDDIDIQDRIQRLLVEVTALCHELQKNGTEAIVTSQIEYEPPANSYDAYMPISFSYTIKIPKR